MTLEHTSFKLASQKMDKWVMVEDSRRVGGVLQALNSTFFSLIPREEGASSPNKIKPISLYNVIYKIISKVIGNQLRPIIPIITYQGKGGCI